MLQPASVAVPAPAPAAPAGLSHPVLLGLTALVVLGYFWFSSASTGLYQQDEAGHYLNMLAFWDDPKLILGNWPKFGYKLLYVVPALGGEAVVKLLNCGLAAGAGYLAARAVQARGTGLALVAFLLTVSQPLWVMLAFRNYSEIPTAFLLVLAYYLHTRQRPALAMLCLSYICTIRQELYPLLGLYGLDLLRRRQWLAAAAGAGFPLVQNFYGAWFTGDPLYLLHQLAHGDSIQGAYPRQGFNHYFLTSMVIFGPVVVALFVHYVGWSALKRRQPDWYLVVPIGLYFLLHSLFNWQAVVIGPSTGGNLRYLLVIGPLMAVAGTYGLADTLRQPDRWKALYWLGPLLLLTVVFLNYKSNLVLLSEESDPRPALGVGLAAAALLLPGTASALTAAVAAVAALVALLNVRPLALSEEDQTTRDVAQWFRQAEPQLAGRQLYVNHSMFFYWLGRNRQRFAPPARYIDQTTAEAAPKGSIFLWDSHYGYRPKQNPKAITYEYFARKPNEYALREQFVTGDQSFGVLVFEKK